MSALPGMRERTILMGGFSKAYAMTGWRVGYVCAPAGILEASSRSTSTGSCRPRLSPGRGARRDHDRRRGRGGDAARNTTAGAGSSSTGSTRWDSPRSSRGAPSMRSRELRRPAGRRDVRRAAHHEEHVAAVRGARSGRPAPATSGCATRPATRRSRRRCRGSAGSWTARRARRGARSALDAYPDRDSCVPCGWGGRGSAFSLLARYIATSAAFSSSSASRPSSGYTRSRR